MFVIFLGPPGAGKGTQAHKVAEELGILHVATGDILREDVKQGSDLGLQAKSFMDRGELVPDDLVIAMIMERISRPDAVSSAVFDGFPRNISQAEALESRLADRGASVSAAVYLKVSEAALVSRLAGRWLCKECGANYHEVNHPPAQVGRCDMCGGTLYQRSDDAPETVHRRLQVFLEQTEPALEYYRQRGLLAEVPGEGPIAEVTERIIRAVSGPGL